MPVYNFSNMLMPLGTKTIKMLPLHFCLCPLISLFSQVHYSKEKTCFPLLFFLFQTFPNGQEPRPRSPTKGPIDHTWGIQ